jgi:hypothetical protein
LTSGLVSAFKANACSALRGEMPYADSLSTLTVADDEVFVRHERSFEREVARADAEGLRIHAIDQGLVDVLFEANARVERRDVFHMVVAVILREQAQGLGLHAQVHVLADQDDLATGVLPGKSVGHVQDLVVRRPRLERHTQVFVVFATHLDDDVTEALADLHALVEEWPLGQPIHGAQELAGVKIERLVALLETVQLLQHRDGNDDIVLLELIHAFAVVKNDVGVEHEHPLLPGNCHRVRLLCCCPYDDGQALHDSQVVKLHQLRNKLFRVAR